LYFLPQFVLTRTAVNKKDAENCTFFIPNFGLAS
jgi:hypothetical protein